MLVDTSWRRQWETNEVLSTGKKDQMDNWQACLAVPLLTNYYSLCLQEDDDNYIDNREAWAIIVNKVLVALQEGFRIPTSYFASLSAFCTVSLVYQGHALIIRRRTGRRTNRSVHSDNPYESTRCMSRSTTTTTEEARPAIWKLSKKVSRAWYTVLLQMRSAHHCFWENIARYSPHEC